MDIFLLTVFHVPQEILFVFFAATFLTCCQFYADIAFIDFLLKNFWIETWLGKRKFLIRSLHSHILLSTHRFTDVHVTTVFDDDLTLLCCWSICKGLKILMNNILLANFWPCWTAYLLDDHKNNEKEKQR